MRASDTRPAPRNRAWVRERACERGGACERDQPTLSLCERRLLCPLSHSRPEAPTLSEHIPPCRRAERHTLPLHLLVHACPCAFTHAPAPMHAHSWHARPHRRARRYSLAQTRCTPPPARSTDALTPLHIRTYLTPQTHSPHLRLARTAAVVRTQTALSPTRARQRAVSAESGGQGSALARSALERSVRIGPPPTGYASRVGPPRFLSPVLSWRFAPAFAPSGVMGAFCASVWCACACWCWG